MTLNDYLVQLIARDLGGDTSRFDELWKLVPDFGATLRSLDASGNWLHWRRNTFDGWYCVADDGGFEVYFQERGQRDVGTAFTDERKAVRYAVNAAIVDIDATR